MSVFDDHPSHCPDGHRLGPGRVLIGWMPCQCRPAQAKGTGGHRWVRCTQCLDAGTERVWYTPAHEGG